MGLVDAGFRSHDAHIMIWQFCRPNQVITLSLTETQSTAITNKPGNPSLLRLGVHMPCGHTVILPLAKATRKEGADGLGQASLFPLTNRGISACRLK